MADPTPYEPGYDFTASDKGPQLNVELADVAEATAQIVAALRDIRRADGALKNGVVTVDSLATSVIAALGPNGDLAAEALADAEAAAATATTQATAATTQATAAATSAGTATTQATAAAASAATATAQAAAGTSAANTATTQAGVATTQAAAAAASAAAAAAPPTAFVAHRNNADQTGIVTATATKVVANSEVFDQGAYYDNGLARWTPPAGRYRITAAALFSAAVVSGEQYRAMLYVNGILAKQAIVVATGTVSLSVLVSAVLVLDGDDYVEFFVRGDGAGDKTISGSPANTWFEGSAL
jgi:hypothetical protein